MHLNNNDLIDKNHKFLYTFYNSFKNISDKL